MHHGLLDGVGLVASGLEGVDLVVHVCEDGGEGALYVLLKRRREKA